MMMSNNSMFIPRVHRKNQDPASPRPTWWEGSACSCPLGAVEEEGQDGNWNPIYLARLTRAFCPSLSRVPLSPIKVWSPSSRNHKSYVEKEKGKRIRFKMYSPPLIAQLVKNHLQSGDPSSIPGSVRSAGEGIGYPLQYSWASLVAQLVKNTPPMQETWVQSLGWEDPLEKGKATHSSILAWRIPWTA